MRSAGAVRDRGGFPETTEPAPSSGQDRLRRQRLRRDPDRLDLVKAGEVNQETDVRGPQGAVLGSCGRDATSARACDEAPPAAAPRADAALRTAPLGGPSQRLCRDAEWGLSHKQGIPRSLEIAPRVPPPARHRLGLHRPCRLRSRLAAGLARILCSSSKTAPVSLMWPVQRSLSSPPVEAGLSTPSPRLRLINSADSAQKLCSYRETGRLSSLGLGSSGAIAKRPFRTSIARSRPHRDDQTGSRSDAFSSGQCLGRAGFCSSSNAAK